MRALVVPREHGAWGLLFIPLLTGATVGLARGGNIFSVVLLILAAFALFWLRTPVESLLATGPMRAQTESERRYVWQVVAGIAAGSVLLLGALWWQARNPAFLTLGGAAAAAFALQAGFRKLGRSTRMLSQLVGTLGLTATAPAAYVAALGRFDRAAAGLWLANWLFAGNQIHFVQLRIHAARVAGLGARLQHGAAFLAGHVFLIAVLATAIWQQFLPLTTCIAFLPVVIRGSFWFFQKPAPLAVRRLGWTEMAHGLAFGILLSIALILNC